MTTAAPPRPSARRRPDAPIRPRPPVRPQPAARSRVKAKPVKDQHPKADPTDSTPSWWSVRALGVLAFVLLFGCLLGLAVFHSVLVQNQGDLDRLNHDVALEEQRASELRLRFTNSESDARIIANARAADMVLPRDRKPLQAVVPGAGATPAPAQHPFGIPPTTLATTTTAAPGGPAAATGAASTLPPAPAPTTTGSTARPSTAASPALPTTRSSAPASTVPATSAPASTAPKASSR